MGGFLGIGGSSAKTDRGRQLGGWNAEWNIFNTGMPFANDLTKAGTGTTNTGIQDLNQSKQFWQDILSGNRTTTSQFAAPIVNDVNAQADAARREQAALGTSRGGGVNAANQQAETARMTAVNNAVWGARPVAAQELGKIGETEASLGQRQLAMALQAMGLSAETAQAIVSSSTTSRTQSFGMNPANALPTVFMDAALGVLGL